MAKKSPKAGGAAPTAQAAPATPAEEQAPAAPEAEPPTAAPEDSEAGAAGTNGGDGLDAAAQQAALESAKEEIDQLKDQALRSQAEVENIRRRAARDVENAHKFALERFAKDLLPALDGLQKSAESAAAATDVKAVADGVALSLKLLLDTLRKNGIEQVDPLGEPFDPARSEAMALVENPDAEPNSVMEVMQKGYLLNGRLLRAAKVIVAKPPEAGSEG